MKRKACILLILLLLPAMLALSVSANELEPKPFFEVKLENAPAEAYYLDLLIEMTPDDVDYTDNRQNFPDPSWGQLEIFSYSDNDYISYTFHCRGAEGNIKIEDGKVKNVQYIGGCNGNLKGIGSLVEGMDVDEVISRLEGTTCGGKATSCPDQLATALKQAKNA